MDTNVVIDENVTILFLIAAPLNGKDPGKANEFGALAQQTCLGMSRDSCENIYVCCSEKRARLKSSLP